MNKNETETASMKIETLTFGVSENYVDPPMTSKSKIRLVSSLYSFDTCCEYEAQLL